MTEPGLAARALGRAAYELTLMQPMIPTYVHLLASALFPIVAGAHASLSRPSSAKKPSPKHERHKVDSEDEDDESSDDEDEDEEETQKMEGLSPSDAIVMPLLAGTTLAGLYFLIKYLEDPALVNKILNGYFALFGVFSVARLITDALDIGHSLIFPRRFALKGVLYHVCAKDRKAIAVGGNTKDKKTLESPLPGFLARIPLPNGIREMLWADRAMPGNKWTIRMYIHRIFAGKAIIGPHGFAGSILSILAVGYFNFVGKPWYLTNLMGFGFSYGALQIMSPTTFATGSLILSALFFYDIYFVFFTPMMVTVAKSLDVPIKLVFPRPSPADSTSDLPSLAMLGLGDVVLPGIMIGLALRFDLFLFYLRRQYTIGATSAESTADTETVKEKYHPLAGRWSDHFWTHSFFSGYPLFLTAKESKPEPPFTFPKTYFKASIVGYVIGMLATLGVMHVWGHAQPALLYLVPGVLISLWSTALVRGELGLMWNFSEAVEDEEDTTEENKADEEKKKPERTSFFSFSEKKALEREARMKKALGKHVTVEGESEDENADAKTDSATKNSDKIVKQVADHQTEREVFSFSIEAPWDLKHPRSVRHKSFSGEKEQQDDGKAELLLEKGKPNWAPPEGEMVAEEPAGKRVRLN